MRTMVFLFGIMIMFSGFAQAGFIPPNCSVESWCLKKATPCFLGNVQEVRGNYFGYSRYSVVREVVALCQIDYYGNWERRVILGPVEPVDFRSGAEYSYEQASSAAMNLCERYRDDWISAAPACAD